MDLSTYRPTKNWKKRVWWWAAGVILLFVCIHEKLWIALLVWAVAFILIDEKIKEGYFFDPRDVKKPLTHENLAVITSAILTVIALLKRREENDEDRDNR